VALDPALAKPDPVEVRGPLRCAVKADKGNDSGSKSRGTVALPFPMILKLAAKFGPDTLAISRKLITDPKFREWLSNLLGDHAQSPVQLTPEGRLRSRIDKTRDLAAKVLERATEPTGKTRAHEWLIRAEGLHEALGAVGLSARGNRKERMKHIAQALDALTAEIIEHGLGKLDQGEDG
jgi:hypothetical protein